MKCIQCVKDGKKSLVYIGASTTTLAYFPDWYDEDGNYVKNQGHNTITTQYSCTNGHNWSEKT